MDARSSENQPYPIRNWFSPQDLIEKAGQNIEQANNTLVTADDSFMTDPLGVNLRDYQIHAINKATEAIVNGSSTALLAMATGTGKTRTQVVVKGGYFIAHRLRLVTIFDNAC